jgi:phosphoglycerate dehydrogenase-like enzyme
MPPLDVRPVVGLACSEEVRRTYITPADVQRLEEFAEFTFRAFDTGSNLTGPAPRNTRAERELAEFSAGLDALVVCHGAPFAGPDVLDQAPRLRVLGELEGDRFAYRFDLQAAAARGVKVIETTHASSLPTAEWALALAMIGLRNAGEFFRRIVAHQPAFPGGGTVRGAGRGFDHPELTGKRVGMVGFGHVAWRLVELLRPFNVEIIVYDPYAPRELATAYGVVFAPLEAVLGAEVVFCLVPLTPATKGMIGATELDLLRPEAVFVNVSRGRVVDSAALYERMKRGDVLGCLDVFDPEPIPLDSPIVDLPNVFLSPHIAGFTAESKRQFFALMVTELRRYFSGCEPVTELTPQVVRLRNEGTLGGGR